MQNTCILVVDDDQGIRDALQDYLTPYGFEVLVAEGAKQVENIMARQHVDLIILDIMLPGEDGFSICRRVRINSTTSILMLSAKSDDINRIIGLEIGADDYMAKPFNPRELLARIRSVLRRSEQEKPAQLKQCKTKSLQEFSLFDQWKLDHTKRELISTLGDRLVLSGADYELLSIFIHNATQVLSRERLYDMIKGRQSTPYDRSLEIHISRLRQRLEVDSKEPKLIKTIRGVGYILTSKVIHTTEDICCQ